MLVQHMAISFVPENMLPSQRLPLDLFQAFAG